jgi:predicted DNA-binding transcriptional regulator AlpA
MEILLMDDVAALLKVSQATLYRWVSASRTGKGSFPLPISQRGQTIRWNSEDIDAWCRAQSTQAALSKKHSLKERRRKEDATTKILKRHGIIE